MSKTSLCIQMLEILYSKDVVGIDELAGRLETNPRNIPEYKKELEDAGYIIDTVRGRYGGYCLVKKYLFPTVKLTTSEKLGIKAGYDYLIKRDDYMRANDLNRAMAKIASAVDLNDKEFEANSPLVVKQVNLAMGQRDLANRYVSIGKCILNKCVINMDYLSLDNIVQNHNIHPYKLYMYDDAWYVLAYDELVQEVGYFKLNRISSFEILNRQFRVSIIYNERDYLDEFGMKKNGEWYNIKLKITGENSSIIKEYIYGKDQTIEDIDSSTAILNVKMQNKDRIIKFVLSLGDSCEVLEPIGLKNEIIETCKKVLERYK